MTTSSDIHNMIVLKVAFTFPSSPDPSGTW
jgi:hypothetical protein